jgi:hypothetical protein
MEEELEKDYEIIKKYPELFGELPLDQTKTAIVWGFEVPEFWRPPVLEALEKISEIVKREELDDFRIVQIKEKFASLRIYTNYSTDEIDAAIDEAESTCAHTCMKCGSPDGKFRQSGWLTIECDECYDGS